jgi:hypothetical protein
VRPRAAVVRGWSSMWVSLMGIVVREVPVLREM